MAGKLRNAVLALALVASGSAIVDSSAAPSGPSLRLVQREPIRVRGRHFFAREVVRVTATIGYGRQLERIRADAAGAFVVTFRGRASSGACSPGLTVVAVGTRGSRALLRLPAPVCPPRP